MVITQHSFLHQNDAWAPTDHESLGAPAGALPGFESRILFAPRRDLILFGQFRFELRLCTAVAVSLPVAAAAAPSHPVNARLQLAPEGHQHCLVLPADPPDCAV